jgi:hypothetical protein
MSAIDRIAERLEKGFKSLDPSLIRAIINDHEKPEDHVGEITAKLAQLTPPSDDGDGSPQLSANASSSPPGSPTGTTETTVDDQDTAAAHLHAIFPDLPSDTITKALETATAEHAAPAGTDGPAAPTAADNDHAAAILESAIDALMAEVWLIEHAPRGVDGFATEPDDRGDDDDDDDASWTFVQSKRARRHRAPQAPRAQRDAAPDVVPRYAPLQLSTSSEPDASDEAVARRRAARYGGPTRDEDVDVFVDQQSREGAARWWGSTDGDGFVFVDLHYITANDAKRVAVERARAWWAGLGETKAARAGRARGKGLSDGGVGGVEFITGMGHHSANGRGILSGAVLKALVSDGWEVVANDPGVLMVTGRRKK